MSDLTQRTATELLDLYRRRSASPVEVTAAVLERIDRLNPVLNCFALVAADEAMEAARASEARWQAGEPVGALDGRTGVDQGHRADASGGRRCAAAARSTPPDRGTSTLR